VNLVGLEDEQLNQDLDGEEVGSGERRKGELMKKITRVRFFELTISATSVTTCDGCLKDNREDSQNFYAVLRCITLTRAVLTSELGLVLFNGS